MQKTSKKIAILISPDRVSRCLLYEALKPYSPDSYIIILDKSMTLKKITKLVLRKRINLSWLIQQFNAKKKLEKLFFGKPMIHFNAEVSDNRQLFNLIQKASNINCLLGFRASLIIQGFVIQSIPSFNIHCAKIPDYAGLQSIHRALIDGAYNQVATLHCMVSKVDAGKSVDEEPYILDKMKPYYLNELTAYQAAIPLIQRFFMKQNSEIANSDKAVTLFL